MKLYNSLTKNIEQFTPQKDSEITIYTCGPTVYERAHIGNLTSFIYADTLHRALGLIFPNHKIKHVMNITDVDDKTIRASQEKYPQLEQKEALQKLTSEYEKLFMDDLVEIGVDTDTITFVRATENIDAMQQLIRGLLENGFAYVADDGIYFSIDKYKSAGKTYGQLVSITAASTGHARVRNDEYDKDNIHDFALWKVQKDNEPAWDFQVNGQNIKGRPGWHIECSAMSARYLGQPFDIHTGGIDLKFPHHENEIAQSTTTDDSELARFFVHSEHLLVDGQKMSKSLGNFITLQDIKNKGFDPLAFRLLILQSHYRNQAHFSWENLQAAQNRLRSLRAISALRYQPKSQAQNLINFEHEAKKYLDYVQANLDIAEILTNLSHIQNVLEVESVKEDNISPLSLYFNRIDRLLGLSLESMADINGEQKQMINEREEARKNQNFQKADELRIKLTEQGIEINDTPNGPVWHRI